MGTWIKHNSESLGKYIECSKCHVCIFIHMPWRNYCPNCGDKKKEEQNGNDNQIHTRR